MFPPSLYKPLPFFFQEIELTNIHVEEKFFGSNPSLGKFVHKPIFGSLLNPAKFSTKIRLEMAKELEKWSHDDLPSLTELLHEWVTAQAFPKPAVIFIHCMGGEDRTGEVSGSYYMRYLKWSFNKALSYDNHIEKRNIRCMSANELAWMCYWLQVRTNSTWLGSCEFPTAPYCS